MRRRMFLTSSDVSGDVNVKVILCIRNNSGDEVTYFSATATLNISDNNAVHGYNLGSTSVPTYFATDEVFEKTYNIAQTIKNKGVVYLNDFVAAGMGPAKKCVLTVTDAHETGSQEIGYADGYLNDTDTQYNPNCRKVIVSPGDSVVILVNFELN